MSASSDYWRCGSCGYKNRPDHNHPSPVAYCEQCGSPRDQAAAAARAEAPVANFDYTPE